MNGPDPRAMRELALLLEDPNFSERTIPLANGGTLEAMRVGPGVIGFQIADQNGTVMLTGGAHQAGASGSGAGYPALMPFVPDIPSFHTRMADGRETVFWQKDRPDGLLFDHVAEQLTGLGWTEESTERTSSLFATSATYGREGQRVVLSKFGFMGQSGLMLTTTR